MRMRAEFGHDSAEIVHHGQSTYSKLRIILIATVTLHCTNRGFPEEVSMGTVVLDTTQSVNKMDQN